MIKKLLLPILFVCLVGGIFFIANANDKAEATVKNGSLKEKIEQLNDMSGLKVKTIEKKVTFNKNYQTVLFTDTSGKTGYALLKKGKVLYVAVGDNKQQEDTFKNFLILYGEKPKDDNKEIRFNVNDGNVDNMTVWMKKSVSLEKGKYYLVVQQLPHNVRNSHFIAADYDFK
ncbi:hypothetical protein ACFO4N_12535 [Camelliibacillus cellulosilyticus]|uniref:Uncharacterized protein n=1 Tax=Camelliibacillus cellulosilyticus TaxID=2174486 RepID=A0ABV9GS63_9BACL